MSIRAANGNASRLGGRTLRQFLTPLRMLPDFLIIGAARSGTTSLYNYLIAHPRVGTAFRKEVHFFDKHFERGPRWYRAHFPTRLYQRWRERCGGRFITGEATPYYLPHPRVPERASRIVPDALLIALLRNPVDRAYSHFHHSIRGRRETLPFEEAIAREAERLVGAQDALERADAGIVTDHRYFSYLLRGIYADQLERWLRVYPRERLRVLNSERLYADPGPVVESLFDLLGIPARPVTRHVRLNVGRYPSGGMSPRTRERLLEYFAPHNERLFCLLGERFDWDR